VFTPVSDPSGDEVTPRNVDAMANTPRCNDCVEWRGLQERCIKHIGDLILPTAQYPNSCPHFRPKEENQKAS
jgi:hypothetical protein